MNSETRLISKNMLRGVLAGVVSFSLIGCGGAGAPQPERPGTGLLGEYYAALGLAGPALTQTDAQINFDWGTGTPRGGIGADTFSVLWTGFVRAPISGEYTFYTTSDDGVRFSVNGNVLVNNWNDHGATEDTGKITLTAGVRVPIRLDYYENSGLSQIKLEWSGPGLTREVVPTAVLYPAP